MYNLAKKLPYFALSLSLPTVIACEPSSSSKWAADPDPATAPLATGGPHCDGSEREQSPSNSFTISLLHPSDPAAKSMREQLQDLFVKHDLRKYSFKEKILITDTPSFSGGFGPDPIELSTYLADKGDALLLTFLHEQSHLLKWQDDQAWDAVFERFDAEIPKITPKTKAEIGRGDLSLKVHIAVNWLELQAGKAILGVDRTLTAMCQSEIYPTINRAVIKHEAKIGEIMDSEGLLIEDLDKDTLGQLSCPLTEGT